MIDTDIDSFETAELTDLTRMLDFSDCEQCEYVNIIIYTYIYIYGRERGGRERETSMRKYTLAAKN